MPRNGSAVRLILSHLTSCTSKSEPIAALSYHHCEELPPNYPEKLHDVLIRELILTLLTMASPGGCISSSSTQYGCGSPFGFSTKHTTLSRTHLEHHRRPQRLARPNRAARPGLSTIKPPSSHMIEGRIRRLAGLTRQIPKRASRYRVR